MGRSLRTTAYVVVACALLPASTASAQAVAPTPTPTPVVTVGGGIAVASSPASVARFACARGCGTAGAVRPGSMLRVRGKTLSRADQVVFLGAEGALDDIAAAPSVKRRTSVDVRVPFGAAGGPVAVVDRDGASSVPSAAPLAVEATPADAGPGVEFAVRSPRVYHGSGQPAALTYIAHGAAPVNVAIDLVRAVDGVVIQHWDAPQVVPEVPQVVTWSGDAAGAVQPEGRYLFRVTAAGVPAVLAQAGGVKAPDPAAFEFAHHRFPILGAYKFGSGVAGFGGGRGHQGNDVFAKCGTPLVAAQGGRVEYAGYHGRAGNYLVIDTPDGDHAYMHLRDAALVKADDLVITGQPLGFVGDTGSATACHLHFEFWTEPGWYSGGSPVDPLPILRSWR